MKDLDAVNNRFEGKLKYDFNELMTTIMMKKILEHYEKSRDYNRELNSALKAKTEELAKYR